jgi:hypothetical protein
MLRYRLYLLCRRDARLQRKGATFAQSALELRIIGSLSTGRVVAFKVEADGALTSRLIQGLEQGSYFLKRSRYPKAG